MDLSNYSLPDLIQEWLLDRARAPKLLQRAVELEGVDAVIAYAKENGVAPSTMRFHLIKAGCLEAKPKEKPEDPFADKVAKLWKKDAARLMAEVERLYNARA